MSAPGRLSIASLSDTGRKRGHNEDSTAYDPALGLAVIADGMGGYKSGEVASAIAVASIVQALKAGLGQIQPAAVDPATGLSQASLLLRQAVLDANLHIYRTAQQEPQCQGMGTTAVVLLVCAGRMSIAHVGDSRLYRLRGQALEQLTSDHSLVQELIDRGFFTPEEAAENTPKNLVTRALGIEDGVQVDVQEGEVAEGDVFLLCTDGLTDMLTDEEILLTLRKYGANLEKAAAELVQLANERGGKDNVSVILVGASA